MNHGVQPWEADPSAFLFKSALRGGLGMLRLSSEAMRGALAGREAAADLRELGNKLEVFERFQYALAAIGASGEAPLPLPEAVRRTAALEPWTRLWVVEGVGHACAEAAWRAPGPLQGLLASLAAQRIPAEAWIPLHTGMGLSFAANVLGEHARNGSPDPTPDGLRAALRLLLGLCADNSSPGYARAAFEGLGFVACNLHSHLVPEIDRQLAPELRSYFWHGVGRGLYFSPAGFLPGWTATAMARAASEPPDEEGRRNAIAGAAWALALVNLRHPEVLGSLLTRQPWLCRSPADRALVDGVSSAVAIWCDAAGANAWLTAFLRYRPGNGQAAQHWQRLIEEPCRRAIRSCAGLRRSRRLEDLFRYRPLGGPPR
ncbi:MAG TPA: hypothetical protein VGG03_06500 [Thermoanaerobaculia bacterium]|jgi:hypothetical protein